MHARAPIIPFLAACMGVALFSAMDAVMKGLSIAIGAYNALFWRCVAGSAIGALAMLAARRPMPEWRALRIHIWRGIVVAFMALAFFWAIARLPLAEAIALSFIAPLIALYLAALLLGEHIGRAAIIAALLGLAGVGVILSGKLGGRHDPEALKGAAAVLCSAVLFAYNLILQRRQAQIAAPVEIAFFQNLVIALVLGCAAPLLAVAPGTAHLLPIAGAALLAFASLLFLSWAYARAEAQILIPVEYTAFIWASIMGWLVFGERLTLTTLAGAGLIVTGCVIAARRKGGHVPPMETAAL